MPIEVMVAVSPGLMVSGLAEQLIVGGSNAFTVKPAEHVGGLPRLQAFLARLAFLHVSLGSVGAGSQRSRIHGG